MIIGIGSAGYAALCGDRVGCVVLAVLGLLWLWVNKPVEGPVLWQISVNHGVTTADLLTLFVWAVALLAWRRASRRERNAATRAGSPPS